jgi:hypothetical protein
MGRHVEAPVPLNKRPPRGRSEIRSASKKVALDVAGSERSLEGMVAALGVWIDYVGVIDAYLCVIRLAARVSTELA